MSRLFKYLSAIAVLVIGAVTLVSCGEYDFYKDWTEAGAKIEEENIFDPISLEDAEVKINNDETFVLVLGSSEAAYAVTSVTLLQTQADYYGFEGKLQFVDCTEYVGGITSRKIPKEKLGFNDAKPLVTKLVILCYDKGELILDTTAKTTDEALKPYVSGGNLDYLGVASYIFNDFDYE